MAARTQALHSLQGHVDEVKETEYCASSTRESSAYHGRTEAVALELLARVHEEREAIDQVLDTKTESIVIREPSPDIKMRLCQLTVIKSAYDDLSQAEPDLPFPDSPLPAILAVRDTQQLLLDLEKGVSHIYTSLQATRKHLIREEADLKDSQMLTTALEARVASLGLEINSRGQRSPDEVVQSMVYEQENLVMFYEKETRQLVKALVKFVNNRLALLLAAEELGGPVVGDLPEVTNELLEKDFNPKGRAKRPRLQSSITGMRTQQSIDLMLDQEVDTTGLQGAKDAAAAAMRSLVEDLLNVAAEENSGVYVNTSHESAVSRFLVRAKVAQFHPKDARKLRLIDHGQDMNN